MADATECGRLANVQREQARVASGLTWIAKSRLFSAIFGPDHVHHVQADVGECRTRPGETPLAPDSARMGQVVTCHCGAAFERTETLLIFWVMDDFLCSECGEVLEILERSAGTNLCAHTAPGRVCKQSSTILVTSACRWIGRRASRSSLRLRRRFANCAHALTTAGSVSI